MKTRNENKLQGFKLTIGIIDPTFGCDGCGENAWMLVKRREDGRPLLYSCGACAQHLYRCLRGRAGFDKFPEDDEPIDFRNDPDWRGFK